MKYQITMNDEDYLQLNIFYTYHTQRGKRVHRTQMLLFLFFSAIIILMRFLSGTEPCRILSISIFLVTVFVILFLRTPKMLEKRLRKRLKRIQKDGKLPYHVQAEIEFQDSMITKRHAQGELRLKYEDLDHVYFTKDYIYIFFTAINALVIPYRCLGAEKERVIRYLVEKRPDAWHNTV